jgi:hypothetical protein
MVPGSAGVDTAVRPLEAAKALPLRIGQKTYAKGIGLHANAEVCVQLDGRYEVFQAEVGVLPSKVKPGGSVVFQVDVDGERRFDSGVMRQETPPRPLRVALKGAGQLVLRVSTTPPTGPKPGSCPPASLPKRRCSSAISMPGNCNRPP